MLINCLCYLRFSKVPRLALYVKKVLRELEGLGQSNPKIEEYFSRTTMGRASDDNAWCAAFVAYCLSESNVENALSGFLGEAHV